MRNQLADTKKPASIRSALLVVLLAFCALSFGAALLPLTWDEGEMASRAGRSSFWSRRVLLQIPIVHFFVPRSARLEKLEKTDSLSVLFSGDEIRDAWRGTVTSEGHPQWPVILASLGSFGKSLPPGKEELRFGATLFFALAVGAVFYRLERQFGTETAIFGTLALFLVPRLFAHSTIAAWDSPLTASWLLAWACFPAALESKRGAALYGLFLGMTVASKFSGLGAVLVPVLWLAICLVADRYSVAENRLGLSAMEILKRTLLVATAGLGVFLLLNPPLWTNPLGGLGDWLHLNTHRTLNISTLFLGRMYDLHHPLPWYNTLFWTAITVPAGLLLLAGIGIVAGFVRREQRRDALFLLLNLLVLLVVRACPGTPVHDGVRLFVPAFAFLALFAGLGAAAAWHWTLQKLPVGKTAVLTVFTFAVFNMSWYAPQWLSYYNGLIGGLPGAVRAGMEATYYWDGFDGEVIDWLKENTGPDESVAFCSGSSRTFDLYRYEKERFTVSFTVARPKTTLDELRAEGVRYYVLQRRDGVLFSRDRELLRDHRPAYVKTIRKGGVGPWNLGAVPLVEIYEIRTQK